MRLFIALQPPPETARALHARAAELLAPCAGALRFYAADELHLTLVFLGEQPRPEAPALFESLPDARPRYRRLG